MNRMEKDIEELTTQYVREQMVVYKEGIRQGIEKGRKEIDIYTAIKVLIDHCGKYTEDCIDEDNLTYACELFDKETRQCQLISIPCNWSLEEKNADNQTV